MKEIYKNSRHVMAAAAIALGFFCAPVATATDTTQCDQIQDSMQRAQCKCAVSQQVYNDQTSGIVAQQAATNPYLQKVREYTPGDNSGLPGNPDSCNAQTKSAFDSILKTFGGFLGFDISGSLGAKATGSVCQTINKAILSNTGTPCPKVAIPGFPIDCSSSSGGTTASASPNYGGQTYAKQYSSNNAPAGYNGAASTFVGGSSQDPAATQAKGSGIANAVSCLFTGSC